MAEAGAAIQCSGRDSIKIKSVIFLLQLDQKKIKLGSKKGLTCFDCKRGRHKAPFVLSVSEIFGSVRAALRWSFSTCDYCMQLCFQFWNHIVRSQKCCYTIFVFSCVKMHHRVLLTKKFHFDHSDNLILYNLYDIEVVDIFCLSCQGSEWLFYVGLPWKLQRFEFSIGIFLSAETCNVLQCQLWKRNCMQ